MKTWIGAALICLASAAHAQILFSESFTVILDSTKRIKGSITPELKLQTQKKVLIEFTNMADLSLKLGRNYLTLANKIESTSFGGEVFLSGGYLYAKFKNTLDKHLMLEYYGQVHWAEARGLSRRYSGGVDARVKIIKKQRTGLFFGIGPFYEYENWNYDGVSEERLPNDLTPIDTVNVKLSSYVSFKNWVSDRIFLDLSIYHQSRFDEIFKRPRIASSSRVGYQISENLQFIVMYQNIYDYSPLVPIDRWFHRVTTTLSVSF